MIEIICFIFPALFSVFALERLLSKRLCLRNFLFVFVTNAILVNIVSLFIIYILSGTATMPITIANGIKVSYSLSYLCISFVITCVFVLVERFYFYRLRIKVTDNKDKPKR